jgi:hypothetical protein
MTAGVLATQPIGPDVASDRGALLEKERSHRIELLGPVRVHLRKERLIASDVEREGSCRRSRDSADERPPANL